MPAAGFDFHPHNNPCAQCGKPIAAPVWSEPGDACVTYVWACTACNYEFAAIAVLPRKAAAADRPIAA